MTNSIETHASGTSTLCAAVGLGMGVFALAASGADIPVEVGMISIYDRATGMPPIAQKDIPEVPHPFGVVPPVGVHPRVLFSPEDLPRIRHDVRETAFGRRAYGAVKSWGSNATGGISKPLGKTWEALVAGDLNALDYAESDWWRPQISLVASFEAFICLIEEDAGRGERAAAALATLGRILNGRTIAHGPAKSNPDQSFSLAYDFLHGMMTDAQRADVRKAIAAGTQGKKSHGMDMAPEHHTYNFMTHGLGLVVAALAIEGEEGYDPEIYPLSVDVLRNFLTYGVYPHGAPREGMHYYNFGMGSGGAKAMIAFARRGDNLLGHPHYGVNRDWYLHDMEPFGYAFSMHGDTSNDGGGLLDNYVVRKKVWADDPVVDFVWRNRIKDDYSGMTYRGDFLLAAIFPSDWKGGENGEREPKADQWGVDNNSTDESESRAAWNPAALGQPLSFFDPGRGLLMTRSEWGRDALKLHFESKHGEHGPSHSHANRNDFTLSALGRKWAIDLGFGLRESKQHNIVLIDGQGQGDFTPSGRIDAWLDMPFATAIVGDASYAYHWRYTFSSRRGSPENQGYEWEVEPLGPPTNNLHTLRAIHNPVEFAWRGAVLIRGDHPYVMIVDDIRKDDEPHLYEWLMQVPNDLQIESATSTEVRLGVIGADEKTPRLLVRFVDMAEPANPVSDIPKAPRLEQYLIRNSLNSVSRGRERGLGKRLVVSTLAVEPRFKTLLFPYLPDTPLPETSWDEASEVLTVAWENQIDHWRFAPGGGVVVERAGGNLLALKTAGFKSEALTIEVQGSPTDVGIEAGRLYVAGRGWQRLTVRGGSGIEEVHHAGSVAKVTHDGDALVVEE